jgi:hypothetical protein
VPRLQLPLVIRHAEQVIDQRLIFLLPLAYHKITHVQATQREMHQSVLLLLQTLKTLQIYNQYWRALKNLKFLHRLLVHLASTAKPSVLVR